MSSAVETRKQYAPVIEDHATAARMYIWDSILDRIEPEDTYPYPVKGYRYAPALKGGN
jgi:hypothetical protein